MRGKRAPLKDVKNAGRSGNVYENKGPDDNMPDAKDDISARLHAILHRNTGILKEPSALLPLFERCGTNLSLRNVDTQVPVIPGKRLVVGQFDFVAASLSGN